MDATYKQSLCSNDSSAAYLMSHFVLFQEDIHVYMLVLPHLSCCHNLFTLPKFCACIDDTFLVFNESHGNCWQDREMIV